MSPPTRERLFIPHQSCDEKKTTVGRPLNTAFQMEPPLINVSPALRVPPEKWSQSEAALSVISQVSDACRVWGFFQCLGHGIHPERSDNFDEECRKFFALPREVKSKVKRSIENSRGWFDDELTKQHRDWKEGFDLGVPGKSEVDGENQWPDTEIIPAFQEVVQTYFKECHRLSHSLLQVSFGNSIFPAQLLQVLMKLLWLSYSTLDVCGWTFHARKSLR